MQRIMPIVFHLTVSIALAWKGREVVELAELNFVFAEFRPRALCVTEVPSIDIQIFRYPLDRFEKTSTNQFGASERFLKYVVAELS